MNNKGLTMVELVVVIVILGVILIILATTMNFVVMGARNASYNTLVEEIKVAGENYASRTTITNVFVRELIEEGLIEAGLDGFLEDPRSDKILNCYQVHSQFIRGTWQATVIPYERANGNCPGRPGPPSDMRPLISLNGNTLTVMCNSGDNVVVTSNRGFYHHTASCPANGQIQITPVPLNQRPTLFTATIRNTGLEIRSSSISW